MGAGFDKYLKAIRKRPAKEIGGGISIIATNTVGGPTQSRCMRCHGMCTPATAAGGGSIMRCDSCGYSYVLKKM